jgi:hypothetical protein
MNDLFPMTYLSMKMPFASSEPHHACSFWDSPSVRPVSFCDDARRATEVAGNDAKAADVSH